MLSNQKRDRGKAFDILTIYISSQNYLPSLFSAWQGCEPREVFFLSPVMVYAWLGNLIFNTLTLFENFSIAVFSQRLTYSHLAIVLKLRNWSFFFKKNHRTVTKLILKEETTTDRTMTMICNAYKHEHFQCLSFWIKQSALYVSGKISYKKIQSYNALSERWSFFTFSYTVNTQRNPNLHS